MNDNKLTTVLITGATGFVGRELCSHLLNDKFFVKGTLLSNEAPAKLIDNIYAVPIEPISQSTTWSHALTGVDVVIHLAARVHIMKEVSSDPLQEFRKVNLHGTENLALQAAKAGVKRFVFLSTIGVNGDNSGNKPYIESDKPNPHNPYSISKSEAETALQRISIETGMEIVIVRAPIVYGIGNPGNFLSLLKFVKKGIPLPFASINNKRSLIYVGNLVDALKICTTHSVAAGRIYLVSDGEDISTSELIKRSAKALGIPARLFPCPLRLLLLIAKLTGKCVTVNSLTGSLTLDGSKIRHELGWVPPFTMEEGLRSTAEWFKRQYMSNRNILTRPTS